MYFRARTRQTFPYQTKVPLPFPCFFVSPTPPSPTTGGSGLPRPSSVNDLGTFVRCIFSIGPSSTPETISPYRPGATGPSLPRPCLRDWRKRKREGERSVTGVNRLGSVFGLPSPLTTTSDVPSTHRPPQSEPPRSRHTSSHLPLGLLVCLFQVVSVSSPGTTRGYQRVMFVF